MRLKGILMKSINDINVINKEKSSVFDYLMYNYD
jgi:hypothetical protein